MRARLDIDVHDDRISLQHTAPGDDAPSAEASLPIGSHTICAREIASDPPRPEELTNAIGYVRDLLDDAIREMFPSDPGGALLQWADLSIAGPVIDTIAAVEIGGTGIRPLDGLALSRDTAEEIFRTLVTERRADRLHNPGLEPHDVDVVVGGCCILVAVMRHLQSDHCTVRSTR
jgi:exopolyphosphatase / guanosine-5'-triphosphate,3'-diphosphate pyrophosphatase